MIYPHSSSFASALCGGERTSEQAPVQHCCDVCCQCLTCHSRRMAKLLKTTDGLGKSLHTLNGLDLQTCLFTTASTCLEGESRRMPRRLDCSNSIDPLIVERKRARLDGARCVHVHGPLEPHGVRLRNGPHWLEMLGERVVSRSEFESETLWVRSSDHLLLHLRLSFRAAQLRVMTKHHADSTARHICIIFGTHL